MPDRVDVRWSIPADLVDAVHTVAQSYGVSDHTAASVLLTLALTMSRSASIADQSLHAAAQLAAARSTGDATKH